MHMWLTWCSPITWKFFLRIQISTWKSFRNVLKINAENPVNFSCRPDQVLLSYWHPQIISKSSQNHQKSSWHLRNVTIPLPKPPKRLQTFRRCHRMHPKAPCNGPRSLKTVKVIRQITLVYSLQWTQTSLTRKSRCQFAVHRLWSVPDCSRLTIRCSRFSVSSLPQSANFKFRMPKWQHTAHSYSQVSNSARPKKQLSYNTHSHTHTPTEGRSKNGRW